MRRRIFSPYERVLATDLTSISNEIYSTVLDRLFYRLLDSPTTGAILGTGLEVTRTGSWSVDVAAGEILIKRSSPPVGEPAFVTCSIDTPQSVVFTAAHATLNRIDIVILTPTDTTLLSQVRDIRTEGGGSVYQTTLDKIKEYRGTVSKITGTAAASPVAPATPAGSIKLAHVTITAVTGIAAQSSIVEQTLRRFAPVLNSGALVPPATGGALGNTTFRWSGVFSAITNSGNTATTGTTSSTGVFLGPAGAVGAPAFSFTGDPNTGLVNLTGDTLGVVVGGAENFRFSGATLNFYSSSTSGIYRRNGNALTYLDIDFPEVTSTGGTLRLFRATNTTDATNTSLTLHKADNTSAVQHMLLVKDGQTSYMANGTGSKLAVGKGTCTEQFEVAGNIKSDTGIIAPSATITAITTPTIDTASTNLGIGTGAGPRNITIGNSDAGTTVSLLGNVVNVTTTNSQIVDKLVDLNNGSTSSDGGDVGFNIKENAVVTGYFKSNTARTGFTWKAPARTGLVDFQTPAQAYTATFSFGVMTGAQTYTYQIVGGTIPSVVGTIAQNDILIGGASGTSFARLAKGNTGTGLTVDAGGNVIWSTARMLLDGGISTGAILRMGNNDNFNVVLEANNTDRITMRPASAVNADSVVHGTAGVELPAGTTAQRPTTPVAGTIRYNNSTNEFEGYANAMWAAVGGGLALEINDANFTAKDKRNHLVNTTSAPGGTITATLPAGTTGANIRFTDAGETWGTNVLVITPAAGEKIDGLAVNETLIMDINGSWVELAWAAAPLSRWVAATSTATTTVPAIIQGGQALGAPMVIGTTDNQPVTIRQNGVDYFKTNLVGNVEFGVPGNVLLNYLHGRLQAEMGTGGAQSHAVLSGYRPTTTATDYLFAAYSNVTAVGDLKFRLQANGTTVQAGSINCQGIVSLATYNSTTANAANLQIDGTGFIQRSTSALRYKTNIEPLSPMTETVLRQRPVYYTSLCENDDKSRRHIGFIGDWELETVPEIVSRNGNEVTGFQYERQTAVLTKAFQELHAEIETLKKEIAILKGDKQ